MGLAQQISNLFFHLRMWFNCCYYNDELHYDSRLAKDIGGKPSFSYIENMPALFLMFEMTVFFAASYGITFFYMRSKLWPLNKLKIRC
jgi:hypothetical protein